MAKTPFERTNTTGINRTKRDGTVLSGVPAHGYNTKTIEPKAEVAVAEIIDADGDSFVDDLRIKEDVVVTITAEESAPKKKAVSKTKAATKRRRAHNVDGSFKADDPSTPDVNEAYTVDSSK